MNSYNGGKSGAGTYQQIINKIPPHSTFVSLFAGHCGIFRNIRRAPLSILNDNNPRVIQTWEKYLPRFNYDVKKQFLQGELFESSERPTVLLNCCDYSAIIRELHHNSDTFIFCDPPYPFDTRRSQQKLYLDDWETSERHEVFLKTILPLRSLVMVCSYSNDLYNDLLKDWHRHSFMSTTRRGLREETIYFNYEPPTLLHDFRYLGNNYRERENIKRKTKRALAKFDRLPELERAAILSAITAQYKPTITKIIL